jgi:hypothetical protein
MVLGFILFVLLILTLLIGSAVAGNINDRDVTLTVKDKERVTQSDSSYYLVYTNNGVYQNVDSMFEGKHNSSEGQGNLERKHTYTCHVQGYRIPFLSMYPNIISCE